MKPIAETYRRFLIDMHVPDWDPRFLATFDPEAFLDAVKQAGVATVTVPANGHTGLCYWTTKTGRAHRNGADLLGRLLAGARARELNSIVYYCTIYVDEHWKDHPTARIVDAEGARRKPRLPDPPYYPSRFSTCCMNDPGYRAFCTAQLVELCESFEFEGVNLDMMFWPTVCYCQSCSDRYRTSYGSEPPRTVDWSAPEWLQFVRARKVWLQEFIGELTGTIKQRRPGCEVTHQSQMYTQDWLLGASAELADETAWLSADLYRSQEELSFYFKLFRGLSRRHPIEQISSWCSPSVHEHAVRRTEAELESLVGLALSNDAAMVFLEQVDPLGTIQPEGYALIGPINERIGALEGHLGGEPLYDVGIYYSFDSNFDNTALPHPVAEERYAFEQDRPVPAPEAHHRAAVAASRALAEAHVPFGVLTRRSLEQLDGLQVLVLPNVVCLDAEEIEAIRAFVRAGGSLYASRDTSLLDSDGTVRPDFGLADVLGVRRLRETVEAITYLGPTGEGQELLAPFTHGLPLTLHGRQTLAEAVGGQLTSLASVVLPFTDPAAEQYASTITNPPGRFLSNPALTRHRFGDGLAMYCSGCLEAETHLSQRAAFARLVASIAPSPLAWRTDAPGCIEVNVYDQPERGTVVAHLFNSQERCPPVPARDVTFGLALRGREVLSVRLLESHASLSLRSTDGYAEVLVPEIANLASIEFTMSGCTARGVDRHDGML